ncbi:hypothetical protein LTR28_003979 [Elasticomyces elasticus]|nr:hypothetical protein LTR28_003979 [Elasticomyces elasticus]
MSYRDEENSNVDCLDPWHGHQLPDFVGVQNEEWDSFRLSEAIDLLSSLSLVTKDIEDGVTFLSMHPLTHAWAKERQEDTVKLRQVWVSVGWLITLSQHDPRIWQQYEKELRPHLHAYLDLIVWDEVHTSQSLMIIHILCRCGWLLDQMRDNSRLNKMMAILFKELKLELQTLDLYSSQLHALHAANLLRMGEVRLAIEVFEQVVRVRGEKLAEDHPARLSSQHALAAAYRYNNQVDKAVELLKQVVKIQEEKLAEDHPNQLESQHTLAVAYLSNRQVDKAIEILEHVVKIREEKLAGDHPDRLASQHELAIAYRSNSQVDKAVELLEQVVKIREEKLAEDYPDRLASQYWLAVAYRDSKQVDKAIGLLEHVVKVQEEKLVEDHPDLLASQHELALAYRTNSQVDKAVELLEHVVRTIRID